MKRKRAGVTLVEMLLVVALVGLLVGITFPAATTGLDTLRLTSATDTVVSFLNGALNRAERRQQVMEVSFSKRDGTLWLRSAEPGFVRRFQLPDGVAIVAILPEIPGEESAERRFYLYPSGTVPRLGVELVNQRGSRRIVRVDPITGVAQVEQAVAR